MIREDRILIAWSGEEADGAVLHAEIVRALAALRTGVMEIDYDPDGQDDHEFVDFHENGALDCWWRITIRHDRVNIERGDSAGKCFVTLDRLHDSMIPASAGDEVRACAEIHLVMAELLLSPETPRDPDAEDRLEGIARDLAFHAHIGHGPGREAMAIVCADGPFGIGRSNGHVSVVSNAPVSMPPTVTSSFLEHVDTQMGRVVRVSVESPSIATIGALTATASARPDAIDVLRALSDEGARRRWTA